MLRGIGAASTCLGGLFCTLEASPASAQQAETIYWSKSEFTIPFHIDNDGATPSAVLLETSSDDGLTWAPYARDGVKSRQFRFTAQGDGLYLFRIKTIDNFGQAYDPGSAPLRVLVDTTSPEVSLEIDIDPQGRLVANFQVIENNPRLDAIRLEFQTESTGSWTAASFDTNRVNSSEITGRGILDVPGAARQLVVRLIVKDAAGNESEVTRLPQLPRTASALSGMQLASGRNSPPPSPKPTSTSSMAGGGAPSAARLGNGLEPVTPQLNSTQDSLAAGTSKGGFGKEQRPYEFQPIRKEGLTSSDLSSSKTGIGPGLLATTNVSQDLANTPLLLGDPGPVSDLKKSAFTDYSTNYSSETSLQASPIQSPFGTTRSIDQKPYHSSSKAFSLDYSVDQHGSSPVTSVELWGTSDEGQIWELWGTDPDGKSPFEITVETEGLFGFRMVLVGTNGLTANRPRNGDNADAWISVDTQLPTARLVSALYGRGNESGSLVIEFNAQDEHFSDRPIKLSYSELPTGPWVTIVSGHENSGRYLWKADPNLPRRVYIRLEAFDQAGNIGTHILDLPVDIEGLAPRGKIQGFRPIPQ